jgi:hypothetical protein
MIDLTLRICTEADGPALQALAERDTSVVPAGRLLAAESCGRLIAAISIESGAVIADPFVPTGDVVDLLRRRSRQLRRAHGPGGPSRLPQLWRRSGSPASAET